MLLRNYYKAVSFCMGGNAATDINLVNYSGGNTKPTTYVDGVKYLTPTKNVDSFYASLSRMSTTTGDSYPGIIIGTGNTPPTLDDYWLDGDMITSFASSVVTTFESDDNSSAVTALCTITNSGSKAFTIREVGLYGKPRGSVSSEPVLVERTVLDVPLTIEPGSVGQLTYTIKLNYPA